MKRTHLLLTAAVLSLGVFACDQARSKDVTGVAASVRANDDDEREDAKEGKESEDDDVIDAALLAKATVTMDEATAKALAFAPGSTITESELEDEDGTLLYTFEMKNAGKVSKVQVNAKTGVTGARVEKDDDGEHED